MNKKINYILIVIFIVIGITTAFFVLRKDKNLSVITPPPDKFIKLSDTVFDATKVISDFGVLVRYPSNGFYDLGAEARLTGSRSEGMPLSPFDFGGILSIEQSSIFPIDKTPNDVIKEKAVKSGELISVYIGVQDASVIKKYPTEKDYFAAANLPDKLLATREEFVIGKHKFFVITVHNNDLTQWQAISYGTKEVVFVAFTAPESDKNPENIREIFRQRNENIFLDFLAYLEFD